ncbi:MAG TPA: TetR family transcriptional regulator [Pseudonocardiaceae bacterium]
MVRWEPGARERLQRAALELFAARGFEQTTAAEIAQSVGLTERTFFRHFADKREVLFYGTHLLVEAFLKGVEAAAPDATPLEVVGSALRSVAAFFPDDRRPYSRTRQAVINQNPALQERELRKMAELTRVIHGALLARGLTDPTAALAAELARTVFGIAFGEWIGDGEQRSLDVIQADLLRRLRDLTG